MELAGTIVHEATHAWLSSLGFQDHPARRHRIEAVCIRAEVAFARRLPDGAELAERYATYVVETLSAGPEPFSRRAKRERDLLALQDLGAPNWLLRILRPIFL